MKFKWPLPGRTPRLALLVAVCITAVGLSVPIRASALPSLYLQNLYYTGGDVTIDVLYSDTKFDDVLQLRTALATIDVADGSQVGSQVTLTKEQLAGMGIGIGDQLEFGLRVLDTGHTFYLGAGDQNPDGFDHAYVRASGGNVYVAFEDLFGGGDRDYNDTIFRFSGGMAASARQTGVPEPASVLLLLSGFAAIGLALRTK